MTDPVPYPAEQQAPAHDHGAFDPCPDTCPAHPAGDPAAPAATGEAPPVVSGT